MLFLILPKTTARTNNTTTRDWNSKGINTFKRSNTIMTTITVCITAHKYTSTDVRCTQPEFGGLKTALLLLLRHPEVRTRMWVDIVSLISLNDISFINDYFPSLPTLHSLSDNEKTTHPLDSHCDWRRQYSYYSSVSTTHPSTNIISSLPYHNLICL